MLLRILWLACLVWTTRSGPVTKIEEYSNDLRNVENIDRNLVYPESNDFEDLQLNANGASIPSIYEDVANFEEITPPPKSSVLAKRMVSNHLLQEARTRDESRPSAKIDRKAFMAYISRNIAPELPGTNLSDTNDVQKLVESVFKLYDQYVEDKMVTSRPQDPGENLMMSDQPVNDDSGFKKIVVPTFDEAPVSSTQKPATELTAEEILDRENKEKRNSYHEGNIGNRTKDMYLTTFKHRILSNINRPNASIPTLPNQFTIPFPAQAGFNLTDSQYAEKIRSFYPTCDIPKNTKDAWKEENLLNLFFNVDYHQNATIAAATLRLHRLPKDNQTATYWNTDICPDNNVFEEEKLLRVSIYWYVKSAKKHSKVKKRLCDSKMVNENSPWVELSVKAATRTWTKSGKNMGLAIHVEDQDGGTLKASKYFKGATCTVGTINSPTPRPIPTLITDTAKRVNDSSGIFALLGVNETQSLPSDFGLLPKIDVCVLELPGQMPLGQLTKDDCELKNSLSELNLRIFSHHHHIRHQKHLENEHQQHNNGDSNDFRTKIKNKKLFIPKELVEKLSNASINR